MIKFSAELGMSHSTALDPGPVYQQFDGSNTRNTGYIHRPHFLTLEKYVYIIYRKCVTLESDEDSPQSDEEAPHHRIMPTVEHRKNRWHHIQGKHNEIVVKRCP